MLGIHVAKKSKVLEKPHQNRKTMVDAIETDCGLLGLNAAQIFTHGPRGYRCNIEKEAEEIGEFCRKKKIALSVHSTYPSVAIWKVTRKTKDDAASKRILGHIRSQLEMCKVIGAKGLVIHLPRRPPEHILETMKVVHEIIKEIGISIWLEMISSKADPELTYETPDKLDRLCKILDCGGIPAETWGLCIDTAHIFGSGLDITDKKTMDKWFKDLSKGTRKKIRMFHLNGSESDLGSGKDKHAIAFSEEDNLYGHAESREKSGLFSVIKFCKRNRIPVILEINRGSEEDAISLIDTICEFEKKCK